MIKIILILCYIIPVIIAAVILARMGYKAGWKGGIRMLAFTCLAVLATLLLAPPVVAEVEGWSLIRALEIAALDAVEGIGVESGLLMKLLSGSVKQLISIPVSCILFILCIAAINLIWMAVKGFVEFSKTEDRKGSKLAGMCIGMAIPLILAVFTLTVPHVSLYGEAARADELIDIVPQVMEAPLTSLNKETIATCTDAYFETTLLAATEEEKLELVNNSLNSVLKKTAGIELYDNGNKLEYRLREELTADLITLSELAEMIAIESIGDTEDILEAVIKLPDKEAFVKKLYSLRFSDAIVSFALTSFIRNLSGDEEYCIPAGYTIKGTENDFVELLETADDVFNNDVDILAAAMKLRNSPLIAPEIFAKLSTSMRGGK